MEIREINNDEIFLSLKLVWEVFLEFEAPDYSQEGIDEFGSFLDDKEEIAKLSFFGALNNNVIVGILAIREKHISLFFVNKEYHKKGIGKSLFTYLLEKTNYDRITVNSSPYAQEFYHKLGFEDTGSEQITNGIRYIPMVYTGK